MNVAVRTAPTNRTRTVFGVRVQPDASETWNTYTLGDQLAKGGMAAVHEIFPEYKPKLVAKIFGDKMLARIKNDPKIAMRLVALVKDRTEIGKSLKFATWPRRILFSKERPNGATDIANSIVGFTMPKLENTVSLQELLMAPERRLRLTPSHTAHIASTIADQIDKLHRHPWGFVFGDLSPNNIHISTDFKRVTFIDTDSFQFSYEASRYSFTLQGITPGYKSPGVDDQLKNTGRITPAHDDYVLAILIFQLLMMDRNVPRHPLLSGNTPINSLIEKRVFPYLAPDKYPLPDVCLSAYRSFPASLQQAFTRTFTTTATVSALEWTRILGEHRRCLQPRS